MTKKGILKLMIGMTVLGVGIAAACSATDEGGTPKPPHTVNLINDLVGTYTPIAATIKVGGLDIVTDANTTIESKLVGTNYVFNVGALVSGAEMISFTENKVISVNGKDLTQQFIFISPDSATLVNTDIKISSTSRLDTSLDVSYNTADKKLSVEGVEIATKS